MVFLKYVIIGSCFISGFLSANWNNSYTSAARIRIGQLGGVGGCKCPHPGKPLRGQSLHLYFALQLLFLQTHKPTNKSCLPYYLFYVIRVLVYNLFIVSTLHWLKHTCESGCRVHVYDEKLFGRTNGRIHYWDVLCPLSMCGILCNATSAISIMRNICNFM